MVDSSLAGRRRDFAQGYDVPSVLCLGRSPHRTQEGHGIGSGSGQAELHCDLALPDALHVGRTAGIADQSFKGDDKRIDIANRRALSGRQLDGPTILYPRRRVDDRRLGGETTSTGRLGKSHDEKKERDATLRRPTPRQPAPTLTAP